MTQAFFRWDENAEFNISERLPRLMGRALDGASWLRHGSASQAELERSYGEAKAELL